jgi:hypothetical protein
LFVVIRCSFVRVRRGRPAFVVAASWLSSTRFARHSTFVPGACDRKHWSAPAAILEWDYVACAIEKFERIRA